MPAQGPIYSRTSYLGKRVGVRVVPDLKKGVLQNITALAPIHLYFHLLKPQALLPLPLLAFP